MLESFVGYIQHVDEQTHAVEHSLDHVITSSENDISGVREGQVLALVLWVQSSLTAITLKL